MSAAGTTPGADVRRLDLGYFLRPAHEFGGGRGDDEGGDGGADGAGGVYGAPRAEPVYAYLVRRDEGLILFDTGIGAADPETEAHYRPRRRSLPSALVAAGVDLAAIGLVVNCHLHFDHCGGNPLFPDTPILAQAAELAAARAGEYTFEELVDFAGVRYEELDGEYEVWPGVWIIPTPGHSDGHQSLVVRRADGTLILAGQAHDFASGFGSGELAIRAVADGIEPPLPEYRPWLRRLLEFDPRRVVFAHDAAVWEPPRD